MVMKQNGWKSYLFNIFVHLLKNEMTNEIRRIKEKIKTIEQDDYPVKQVCIDLLKLFDKSVNEYESDSFDYLIFLEDLMSKYKEELKSHQTQNFKQNQLFNS